MCPPRLASPTRALDPATARPSLALAFPVNTGNASRVCWRERPRTAPSPAAAAAPPRRRVLRRDAPTRAPTGRNSPTPRLDAEIDVDVDVDIDVVGASEADARDAAGARSGDLTVRRVIGELDEMQKRYDAVIRAVATDGGPARGMSARF